MQIDGTLIPMVAIIVGILGIGLPTSLFGLARKWGESHREMAGPILACVTIVAALGVLGCVALVLALSGWLPPLNELLEYGNKH